MANPPVVRPGETICRVSDMADPSSELYVIKFDDGEEVEIFLVRRGEEVFGYVNECPHEEMPLQWEGGSFLTTDGKRILCAVHGATFNLESGDAISGPALPDGCLMRVPLAIADGEVRLAPR
ncbi:MAG TPA: Rieske 2Fe-2S domain-containing protein [Alphaproteobacteria bacterium]|jgi:nitrite reductase/ring-hydroxylating ferredoxin subunit